MLQEAVDALMDNGRHGRPVTGTGNRPLKSLSDMLKGKQGRFRQNLLGKRVDYSGRSVIVVGPELKLNQAGLPKEMALTLFEPFIMRRLKERGFVHTVRSAKKLIEKRAPIVWDILDEVIKGHPIMLKPRAHPAPAQHPGLRSGPHRGQGPAPAPAGLRRLQTPTSTATRWPSTCPCPTRRSSRRSCSCSPRTTSSPPADGRPITTPSQDITLGAYFLTYDDRRRYAMARDAIERRAESKCRLKWFNDFHEVLLAHDCGDVHIHEFIRMRNPDLGRDTEWGDKDSRFILTTAGRCIFNEIWPDEMGFYNAVAGKKALGRMVKECYDRVGRERLIRVLDDLKDLGYEYATRAGFSIGITDMITPENKGELIQAAWDEVGTVRSQREEGVITELERYNKCIDVWTQANNELADRLFKVLERNEGKDEINPVFAMLDSGARGSRDQVRQLAGMRGLMAKPSGEIIERPIIANFREGLSVLEYFISSHGARKGLADTALKTADSGYMTRKLVDVAHDVICCEKDCGTVNGIWVKAIREGDEDMVPLIDRIIGRHAVDDIYNPYDTDELIVAAGEEITSEIGKRIVKADIERVHIRSVLTCESERGVCCRCYGRNLATNLPPAIGDALGIIAAQSIGEPGTQLTMRTFHYGGTASASFREPVLRAREGGILRLEEVRPIEQEDGSLVVLNKNGFAILEDEDGVERERFELIPGAVLAKPEGGEIAADEIFAHWDPYSVPIITKSAGRLEYRDLIEGVTMKREIQAGGSEETTVMEHREDLHPQFVIVGSDGEVMDHYSLPAGAHIMVSEGERVHGGQTLARTPRQSIRTKDITGGLPRVAELFEARRPKEAAEIARIDGIVELGQISRGKRTVTIRDPENDQVEDHNIPAGKRVVVFNGDFVRKGQPLTDGAVVPQEILEVCGPQDLQEYLVNEVQAVYRLQGVEINDKHIEIIVRQMMRKVRITEPGTTQFLFGEAIDRSEFLAENQRVLAEGGQPAEAQPILLGITKASLATDSFISAASFQDTTRVLTEASTFGRVDYLHGFKENVIMGHLIPAGTGYHGVRNVVLEKCGAESPEGETEAAAAREAEAKKQREAEDTRAQALRLLKMD